MAVAGVVSIVAILSCPIAGYLVIRQELGEANADTREERAQAEEETEQHVRGFAEGVIAAGDPDIPDEALQRLASGDRVTVREVQRAPAGLQMTLTSRERYQGGLFAGSRSVVVCYEVVFTGLGTAGASYQLTPLPSCPP